MSSPRQVHRPSGASSDAIGTARRKDSASVESRVRQQIKQLLPSEPKIIVVAAALDMTVRTLQRRLAARDLSYREILDDIRRCEAERDLMARSRSVAEIARRLGYSDASHFVRAFRRWTGCCPSQFVKSSP